MNSVYDPDLWDNKTPANVLGGRNRATKAVRDKLGRFMPSDQESQKYWTLDPDHGKAGGLKLLEKYGREYFQKIGKRK